MYYNVVNLFHIALVLFNYFKMFPKPLTFDQYNK